MFAKRRFKCLDCQTEFEVEYGRPRWTLKCPNCGSSNIVRVDRGRGFGWRWGGPRFIEQEAREQEYVNREETTFGWRGGCRGRGLGLGRGRGFGRGFGRGRGFSRGRNWDQD